jgi:hypothetical protein
MGGLRLLTLNGCEQVAKLPAYFTGEELSALLTWMIDKNSVMTFPETFCIAKVPRKCLSPKLKIIEDPNLIEIGFDLIPNDVFPKTLPDFKFTGFHKALKTFTNVIYVVPNKDIFISSMSYRSGFPMTPDTIRYEYSQCKFVRVKHEASEAKVAISVSINGQLIANRSFNFSWDSPLWATGFYSSPPLLSKGRAYNVTVALKLDAGTGYFEDVPLNEVNKHIREKMDKSLYTTFSFKALEEDTPLFVSHFDCIPFK